MGKFVIAVLGVVSGFVLAHLVNQTPAGKMAFARILATVNSLRTGFRDTYR
ncbi:MAG: hypothetical protein HOL65_01235 [Microbacteriaceae bacterium]|jgi:hypothetical protein|nr:hypothetical protein [Microbacteriaceae bacterium]MBT5247400.1 hypothetical protein [Microbacteriaceae bacterium]MBT5616315.1 hypothetical protein [Microbacteriaceae bacterium]MBT5731114.1 hypothetical protein [Microbacteriaceae bacterium]